MSETIKEEKIPTLWDKKSVQILILIFLPLLIGTVGRLVIFLFENLPAIIRWVTQKIWSIADFIVVLMISSPLWWALITIIINWILGIVILVFIYMFVVMDT